MSKYKEYGYLDFSKLWEMLQKKKLNKQYLINNGIHRNTIYKLVNNENVTADVICKLCYILNTQPKNIMDYKPPAVPDQAQPEEPQSHTEPPEDAQTVTQSAEDPLDSFTSFDDMPPEQLEELANRAKARQEQETPPEPIPPEEWPFH